MKITRFVLPALLFLSLAGLTGRAASAQPSLSAQIHSGPGGTSVDLGYFYDDLASYGNWIERPSYGWVWTPRSVSSSWQPYSDGHWVWTDQGWTWVTDEPYGWATYHYGRWYDDPEIGWSWVPGEEWSPAWVSWQEGGDYIGWAPLPPSVTVSFGGALAVSLAPQAYLFVSESNFLAPRLNSYFVPRERVVNIYRETRNVTVYRQVNNRVYNAGVGVDTIQRRIGRPVPRYQLSDATSARGTRVQGNQVSIFRPRVQKTANIQPPSARPVAKKAVVNAAQFQQSHPDRAARRAQAQGTNAPAPSVQPAPVTRPARQPRNAQTSPEGQRQAPPAGQARPRVRNPQLQTPPPGQMKRQNPPPSDERPQVQEKRQPRNQPPPQAQPRQGRQRQQQPPAQRQAEPKQQRQQPPPANNQRQNNNRKNNNNDDDKEKPRKPPVR
jgi:hypothetical protein